MNTRKPHSEIIRVLLFIVIGILIIAYCSCSKCEWTHYLKNTQRTAYSFCQGPGSPDILWKVNSSGDFDTSLLIIDGKVVGLKKDNIYHLSETQLIILNLLTGDKVSIAKLESIVYSIISVEGNIIGIQKEKICQIDPISGSTTFLTSIPANYFFVNPAFPLILKDSIIIPTTPAVCISKTDFGELWNLNNVSSLKDFVSVNLAGDESGIYFILEKEGELYIAAVDSQKGTLEWKSEFIPAALHIAVTEDGVFCGGMNLWKFSHEGNQLWEFSTEEGIVSNMVIGPDAVYCADAGSTLYKVDFEGNLLWKTYCEVSSWYFETHLVGGGDILYSVTNSGDLTSQKAVITAFSMKTGKKLWNLELGGSHYVKAPPVLVDGILIVGTVGGDIMAVASDPDIFVKQGDTFVEMGNDGKAAESYKKALELCEKKGLTEKYQKILEHVVQRGFTQFETPEPPVQTQSPAPSETAPPESSPPDTLPSGTEPSQSPPPGPEPLHVPEYLIVVAGIIGGILGLYAWQKYK
ncbi:MAG: PQQ-binding-like beta-propeller repeat protein [Candidatus Methanofastidiosia archaeon]|jgi:outer membrane protein assembly factor BamB